MPVFGFGKQWLHPHFVFAHGLLISFRLMVHPDSFEVAGMERPMHLTTLITGSTLRFEWTGITRGRVGTVLCLLPRILHLREGQQLASWADIAVMLGIIGKLSGSEIGSLVFPVRQRNIGADASVFQGGDVFDGAILRVAGHRARPEFPAKTGAKDQVAHRLV